jgi:glucose/arabinose dehydrogenase
MAVVSASAAGMLASFAIAAQGAAPAVQIAVPPGFQVQVFHPGVGPARHIAVRPNGDLYVSARTRGQGDGAQAGIIALRDTDRDGTADVVQRFGDVDGTGIRFHRGALYATSASKVFRFRFSGGELIPAGSPQVVLDGMPDSHFTSRGIAFDDRGGLLVSMGGANNICAVAPGPEPKGALPCPDLQTRAGVWRYVESADGQRHPQDGIRVATGVRDMMAIDWDPRSRSLYGVMQGRNGINRAWPKLFSEEDNALGVAEELHRLEPGAHLGWPYSYWDGRTGRRMLAPEYGGDGKTLRPHGAYTAPIAALAPHSSPLDMAFQHHRAFPPAWRGGAFVAQQGGSDGGKAPLNGYDVLFVPISADGVAGQPRVFATGFAGAPEEHTPAKARHRPSGLAVGPDGALYILDAKRGRIWLVKYAGPRKTR